MLRLMVFGTLAILMASSVVLLGPDYQQWRYSRERQRHQDCLSYFMLSPSLTPAGELAACRGYSPEERDEIHKSAQMIWEHNAFGR